LQDQQQLGNASVHGEIVMSMEEIHVWLGIFPSAKALSEYFEESYDEDDSSPINQFAKDQGERWYDHDWVERGFKENATLKALIRDHSYSASYMEAVVADAQMRGIGSANTFVMADIDEFDAPKTVERDSFKLYYLGRYRGVA
jgi:hypothetical protein